MTTTHETLPLLIRREKALTLCGLDSREFSKLVDAEVIKPVYLVWEVVDAKGKVLFAEMAETKATTQAAKLPGAQARPVGRAYFRSADVVKL